MKPERHHNALFLLATCLALGVGVVGSTASASPSCPSTVTNAQCGLLAQSSNKMSECTWVHTTCRRVNRGEGIGEADMSNGPVAVCSHAMQRCSVEDVYSECRVACHYSKVDCAIVLYRAPYD